MSNSDERFIPKVNIGLIGHVDHGKCIAKDETILVNNNLISGEEFIRKAQKSGTLLWKNKREALYEIPELFTYSIDNSLSIKRAKAKLYLQDFSGELLKLKTRTGRTIKLTRNHPLLVNRDGKVAWEKTENIEQGDHIAILREMKTYEKGTLINPEYKKELSTDYFVLDRSDYIKLKNETDDFSDWNLSLEEIDLARKLLQQSKKEFAENCSVDYNHFLRIFSGKRNMGKIVRNRIENYLRETRIPPIKEDEILLIPRGKYRNHKNLKLKEIDWNSKFIKFLAFLTAEGTSTETTIQLTQKDFPEMRDEVLAYLEEIGLTCKPYDGNNYRINSKLFIDYLKAKFKVKTGNCRETGIPVQVLSLPKELKSTFFSWFFTFESEVGSRRSRIVLSQANKNNINILSHLLSEFGIFSHLYSKKKCATNTEEKKKRKYWIISISGSDNLAKFKEEIGFKNPAKNSKLSEIKKGGKTENIQIPINPKEIRKVVDLLLSSKGNSFGVKKNLKERQWYLGYKEALKKGKITRSMFKKIKASIIDEIKQIKELMKSNSPDLKELLDLASISYDSIAEELNISHSEVVRWINGKKGEAKKRTTFNVTKELINKKVQKAQKILAELEELIEGPLLFDEVEEIETVDYNDKLVDLVVPSYRNFFGGFGGILCHNSTLCQAISGKWTDTHSEEIKRGITIRLGYADATIYKCEECEEPTCYCTTDRCTSCFEPTEPLRTISLVDVPGHKTLMGTVLSGAALMDGTLLVIAVDESCPQPQTAEHLKALDIAGIENIVIVQNKIDKVSEERAKESYEEIQEFVEGSVAEDAPIIPVSALQRVNIDVLLQTIQEEIPTPERDPDASPRMMTARSFDVNKPGTEIQQLRGGVIGGSLTQGELELEDEIEIKPGVRREDEVEPIKTKVRGLEKVGEGLEKAGPGGLLGVQTNLDPSLTKSDSLAGSLVGYPGELPPLKENLTLEVHLFEKVVGLEGEKEVEPINTNEPLMLTQRTAKTAGVVTSARTKDRQEEIEIKLKLPVCAEKGDRVAISRQIENKWRLIGYGLVQ